MKIKLFKDFIINELKSNNTLTKNGFSENIYNDLKSLIGKQKNKLSDILNDVEQIIFDNIIEYYNLDQSYLPKLKKIFKLKATGEKITINLLGKKSPSIPNWWTILDNSGYIPAVIGLNDLLRKMEFEFPDVAKERVELKLDILPYKKSEFKPEDELAKRIYDWDFTFELLEKLLYDFISENVDDDDFKAYNKIIDKGIDDLKEYIKQNNYSYQEDMRDPNDDWNGRRNGDDFSLRLIGKGIGYNDINDNNTDLKMDLFYFINGVEKLIKNNKIKLNNDFFRLLENLKKWTQKNW
jgi:hypothetical protein